MQEVVAIGLEGAAGRAEVLAHEQQPWRAAGTEESDVVLAEYPLGRVPGGEPGLDSDRGSDAAAGDPAEQFRTIDRELSEYGAGLETRPQVVVLNKLDLLPEPPAFELADDRIQRVFALSCATGAGVEEFRRALFELVPEPEERTSDDDGLADFLVYRPAPRARLFKILRTERGFRVTGRAPEREELEEALRAAGAKTGDEVEVGDEVLEFQ